MERARLKTRNGKVLMFYRGIWYTEEAFERLFPKQYAEMFPAEAVAYA